MSEQGEFWKDGRRLRDHGIARVSNNNVLWMNRCIDKAITFISEHDLFTGEDIRFYCEEAGLVPRHPNAWGALTNTLCKRGIIKKTGKYIQPMDKSSHARSIQVYMANENVQ